MVVDHLGHDRDVALRLEDLHHVVVGPRGHRRTGVEAEDAALERVPLLRAGRGLAPERVALVRPAPGIIRERRQAAVRRIDDQGSPHGAGHFLAQIEPEGVVAHVDVALAGVDIAAALRRARGALFLAPLLPGRGLLSGQGRLVAEGGRPLERRDRAEVPSALEVGDAPGGLEFRVFGGCRAGESDGCGDGGDNAEDGAGKRSVLHSFDSFRFFRLRPAGPTPVSRRGADGRRPRPLPRGECT